MTIGREVNLMKNYPYSKRDISGRLASKTDEDRRIARQFDEDFFDGEEVKDFDADVGVDGNLDIGFLKCAQVDPHNFSKP